MTISPKVSVLIITYNHEPYLRQAVESALMQEANFAFEIVIGEDCSTDRTRDVAIALCEQYPDRIRLLRHERNLGANRNLAATLAACRGEYVALLEGDDFWTNALKLQRQADFLDDHPDYAICYHDVALTGLPIGDDRWHRFTAFQDETYTIDNLLKEGNFLPTCSTMFRRRVDEPLPDWFCALGVGDIPLHVLNARHGKLGHLKYEWATYRVHEGGIWSGQNQLRRCRSLIEVYEALADNLDGTYRNLAQHQLESAWHSLATAYCADGISRTSLEESVNALKQDLARLASGRRMPKRARARLIAELYAGHAFAAYQARDQAQVRAYLRRLLILDPAMFRNPGLRSIAVEAMCGEAVTNWLRTIVRRRQRGVSPPGAE